MKGNKWIFQGLLYASIPFLIYYLIKFDYLQLKGIGFNYFYLSISIILLFAGFFISTLSWKYALKFHGYSISNREAVSSHGLSVFAKYIPGKIWVILGRASYIAKEKYKVSELSYISLKEQVLFILIGLILSLIPSILYFNKDYWVVIILITISILMIILFVKPFHNLVERVLSGILKREISFPLFKFKHSAKLSGVILIYWTFWIIAFYFLTLSITNDASWIHSFAFSLAVCYGILVVFLPGGLGVREGIIISFLSITGIDMQTAVLVSLVSRLWFISGEIFIFSMALTLSLRKDKKKQLFI